MKKWTIHLILNTHWDREWFYSKQENEIFLNKNTKNLLKEFEKNNLNHYLYDNLSTLDDYLMFNSDDQDILKKYISNKQLIFAPVYTQPDFYNSTSETTVRNIFLGQQVASKFGGCQKIAYYPDTFGFNNQLPQIFKKSGLNGFVFWRGVNDYLTDKNVWNNWQGIDGTIIPTYNLHLSYGLLKMPSDSFDPNNVVEPLELAKFIDTKFKSNLNELKSRTSKTTKQIAVPCGGDLSPIIKSMPSIIKELNKIDLENEWKISSYDDYFANVHQELKTKLDNKLHQINGELKFGQYSRVHKTIGSQRIDIKQKFKEIEYKFYNQLEPIASYWKFNGGDYHAKEISIILKKMIFNCGHDNLVAACSDITNENVLARLLEIERYIDSLINMFAKMINNKLNSQKEDILLFNPHYQNKKVTQRLTIFTKYDNFKLINKLNNEPVNYLVFNSKKIDGLKTVIWAPEGEKEIQNPNYYIKEIIINNLELEPYSNRLIKILPADESNQQPQKEFLRLDTNRYLISISKNSNYLTFTDKKNDLVLSKWFEIIPEIDAGDSYDFSPIKDKNFDLSYNFKLIKTNIIQNDTLSLINLEYEYKLNYFDLDNDNKPLNITQKLNLEISVQDNNCIEFKINLTNQSKLMKWTINFPTQIKSQFSYANINYGEIARPVKILENKLWEKENWKEKPIEIENLESYVYLKNKKNLVGLVTKGNNEYQIIGKKFDTIKLTLFRTPTALGKSDLAYRPGRASGSAEVMIWTPKSTLQKELEIKFWFISDSKNKMWKNSESLLTDVVVDQNQDYNVYYHTFKKFVVFNDEISKTKQLTDKLFTINGNELILKAFKKHEFSDNYIIRVFNSTPTKQKLNFESDYFQVVESLNLMEKSDNIPLNFDFNKFEIKTLKIIKKKHK